MTNKRNEMIVIIPAYPGWSIAQFMEPEEKLPGAFIYEPIIAWEVTRWESYRDHEWYSDNRVRPITISGFPSESWASRWAIKRDDGKFDIYDECVFDDEADAINYLTKEYEEKKAKNK